MKNLGNRSRLARAAADARGEFHSLISALDRAIGEKCLTVALLEIFVHHRQPRVARRAPVPAGHAGNAALSQVLIVQGAGQATQDAPGLTALITVFRRPGTDPLKTDLASNGVSAYGGLRRQIYQWPSPRRLRAPCPLQRHRQASRVNGATPTYTARSDTP